MVKHLQLPLSSEDIKELKTGDVVLLSGVIYTARDAAHKRIVESLKSGSSPIPLKDATIYYVGPTPAKPGEVIGSAGPTSSYRMDPYAESLLLEGVKVMIGKGPRSEAYKDLLKKYQALYLTAIGGAAVTISEAIKECELVCYPDLGAEAIYKLRVEDFFAIVTYDANGGDLYQEGIKKYQKTS